MKSLSVLLMITSLSAADPPKALRRVLDAAQVFQEVLEMKERTIPQELLDRAECVAIVPSLKKGGFIFGAKYGKGVLTCRPENGEGWTGPSTIRIEGGSFGLQAGGSAVDLVLLIMNRRGADKLLQSRFTLGADATAAAGPVGRSATAQTDVQMYAEILSWSRSRGLFAGVSLAGATLRQDADDNRAIYGRSITPQEIVRGNAPVPAAVEKLPQMLNKYSSRRSP
jgi:lipid-binding SYLF domain-containing protein